MRDDIAEIISTLPQSSRQALTATAASCVALLDQHVPAAENILELSAASVRLIDGPLNSVFALTEERLLFAAPLPQAISWRLGDISSLLFTPDGTLNYFQIKAPGSEYSFGLDAATGSAFSSAVTLAVAVARLRGPERVVSFT
jgi:hypothetical protein